MKKFSLVLIICIMVLTATSCAEQVFSGSVTGNDSQFFVSYEVLNGTKAHEMSLDKDDVIDVEIENISGKINILVTDIDGNPIYKGDDAMSGKFSIKITKSGTYRFSVTGKKAKGYVAFKSAN